MGCGDGMWGWDVGSWQGWDVGIVAGDGGRSKHFFSAVVEWIKAAGITSMNS